jgi:histidinol-phosphate aminotransferase
MYTVCAQLQNAKVIEVPLKKADGFALSVSAILERWDPSVKLIFLCSPNNPTGNCCKIADIAHLCQELHGKAIIVVDEAYVEFASTPSIAQAIASVPNLVILRTFSKAYGLAGARLGLLLAQQEIITWVMKILAPYPLPILANSILHDALSSSRLAEVQTQIATLKQERSRLAEQLSKLPCITKIWPSEGNFLLIETTDAKKIMKNCAARGIVLRDMSSKQDLANCIRISVGLPNENSKLIDTLQTVV